MMADTPGRPDDERRRQAAADREHADAQRRAEVERQNKQRYSAAKIRDAALAAEEKGKRDQEAKIKRAEEAKAEKERKAAAKKSKGRNN